MGNNKPILRLEGLVKRYGKAEQNAVDGIDLEVNQGDFFGLLGPNGSGKTTTISITCGILKPTKGTAYMFGHDVRKNIYKILPDVGLVPETIALYPTLTLRQNLQLLGSLYGLSGRKLKQRIEYCLEIAQLARYVDKQIKSYSGGMKRRANLVAGLIHEPKLLFLDEATANVDPQSRNVIYDTLKHLIDIGITIIYTTHYLEEAENLCNQLVIIDSGHVIAKGSPRELIDNTPNCKDLGEVFLQLTGKSLRDEY